MIRTLQPSAVTHGQEGSVYKKPLGQESILEGGGKGTSVMAYGEGTKSTFAVSQNTRWR